MKLKSLIPGIVAVLTVCLATTAALAEEGVVRGKVSAGLANYTSPSASGDLASTYSTLGLGLTYIFPSNIFVDFTTKIAGTDALYNAKNATAGLVSSDQPFSRTENTLTVGMPFDNGMQGNAGIFTAETTFKLAQFGQFSQKMTGLAAGAGKGITLNEGSSGTLGFNGALALLNASSVDRYGYANNSNLSYGLSLGAIYNYMLNKNIGVSADAKFQSYFIKYSSFSGDERIISAGLSLTAQF